MPLYAARMRRWMARQPLLGRLGLAGPGVEVKAHMKGRTALHYAAKRGDAAAVSYLIESGADPKIETATGLNALAYSRLFGPFPRVEKLLHDETNATNTMLKIMKSSLQRKSMAPTRKKTIVSL